MATNDDVFDMKGLHRKLQHRMNIGVERRREISDVTVHDELARREANDLVGRYGYRRSRSRDILASVSCSDVRNIPDLRFISAAYLRLLSNRLIEIS